MQTNEQAVEQLTDAGSSIGDLSLADYRAKRETSPVAHQPAETKAKPDAEARSDEDAALGEPEAAAGAADDESQEESSSAEEKKPAKKGGWQRKLEKQEREIEDLRAKLAAKPAGTAPRSEPVSAAPVFDKAKPKLDNFESLEAYTEALSDWKADERDFKRAQADAQAKQKADAEKILNDWNSRKAEAKKTHADYDEVLSAADSIKLPPAHQRILLESEHGAVLAYQLAKDQTELKKFASMQPLAAARYFGKLEASLDNSSAADDDAPEPKTTRAPQPIRPVGGRSSAAGTFDVTKSSLADYRKARESGRVK